MSLRLWCEHAWLGGPSASDGVLLDIDDDRFSSVELGITTPPPDAVRLNGLTLPGFVNAHYSTLNRVLRGRDRGFHAALLAGTLAHLDPDSLFMLARACYSELAMAGYTTVGEFLTLHHLQDGSPYGDPNQLSIVLIEAAQQAGVRLGIVDVCAVGSPSPTTEQSVSQWVNRLDMFADGLRTSPDVKIVAGIRGIESLDVQSLREISLWAGQSGLALHAKVDGPLPDGTSVLSLLAEAGVLSNRGGFAAVGTDGTTQADMTAVGQQRGYVVIDSSEGPAQFAYGSFRMAGGRTIAAQSGAEPPDPFAAMRNVAIAAAQDPACGGLGLSELLRTLSVDAAASLGWRNSGLLASGQLADLVTINLSSTRLAGLDRNNILSAVLINAAPSDITHVAVGGKLIVESGRHILGNVGTALDEAVSRVTELVDRARR